MINAAPHIGIVVPVFGHSRLVAEALASIEAQEFSGQLSTVVVIDGDPAPETVETVRTFQRGGDRPIHAVYQRNGRLPKARNTGIRFLLERYPELDAIYLLDADNRLPPRSIAAFWQSLRDNPEAAWAFPDIGFFGLTWHPSGLDVRVTSPRYSVLRHLLGNISEAGSMVRAEVFRRGILYDESFTRGYEDWEYWLQCLGAGLVGVRVADSGFQYRRRPNSMLADADLVSDDIKADIYSKHHALFSADFVAEQFCRECAPLLFVSHTGEPSLLAADGRDLGTGRTALEQLIADAIAWPHWSYLPKLVVVPLDDSGARPVTRLETYFELSDRLGDADSLDVDARLSPLPDHSEKARFRVYRFSEAGALAFSAGPHQPHLQLAAAVSSEIDTGRRSKLQRRYAGPGAYQMDGFVRRWTVDRAPPAAEPAASMPPPKRPLSPEICLIEPSRRIGASYWLGLLSGAGKVQSGAEFIGPLSTLEVEHIQYRGAVIPYAAVTNIHSTPKRRYAFCVISDEYRFLVHATDFRSLGEKVVYALGPQPSMAELYAVAASEHALNAILCREEHTGTLRALGLPSRKLVTPATMNSYFARP